MNWNSGVIVIAHSRSASPSADGRASAADRRNVRAASCRSFAAGGRDSADQNTRSIASSIVLTTGGAAGLEEVAAGNGLLVHRANS